MGPNCNFLKAELNRSLNTICFCSGCWTFSILIFHIELERKGLTRVGSFFSSIQNPILGYPTSVKAELMAEFHEMSSKNDQCSRQKEGTDSEERQVIFCRDMKREEWHDVSLQMWFFSDTLRPARERTGNCLTSVYMSDKTRKKCGKGIRVHMHGTVWTLVKIFNGKDNEVLEYMSQEADL